MIEIREKEAIPEERGTQWDAERGPPRSDACAGYDPRCLGIQ